MTEFQEKFDDEHQEKFYGISVLDGDGEDDRRTARICHNANVSAMNAVRCMGKDSPDNLYRTEDDYMPGHWKRDRRQKLQGWDEQRGMFGFS